MSPRCNTPHSACAQGLYCSDHMEDDDQDRGDEENVERQRTIRHMMTCG